MNKKVIIFLAMSVLVLTACKGKNESNGDGHLKKGNYRNAVNSYTNALTKGKVSGEFYDNFVLAYIGAVKQTAKKNATDEVIRSYVEQIHKNLPKTKKKATIDSVVQGLSEVGVAQVGTGFEYEFVLQGFRSLDSAIALATRSGGNTKMVQDARKKAEDSFVKLAMENSSNADNTVAAEYYLLEANVVAPKNEELKKALNKVRLKNRADWLIFQAGGVEAPSRWVDIYGYLIAFPILNITPTSATGEISLWGSTGNNNDFEIESIKMVATDGREVNAKYVGGGWCSMSDHEGKKKAAMTGKGKGKLLSEGVCNAKISFTYPNGFIPDYVELKDQDKNQGRKYLGQK